MRKEFMYVFQITRMVVFEVGYYTLGNNDNAHFSTSAGKFIRSKRDYDTCGQCQNTVLPMKSLARRFYEKWDKLHLRDLTDVQYEELLVDIEKLKDVYNYIREIRDTFKNSNYNIPFGRIVELSKKKEKYRIRL